MNTLLIIIGIFIGTGITNLYYIFRHNENRLLRKLREADDTIYDLHKKLVLADEYIEDLQTIVLKMENRTKAREK